MDELNGYIVAINALAKKVEQLTSELQVERYYKEEYEKKNERLENDYATLKNKYDALVDKLNEYCEGGNK